MLLTCFLLLGITMSLNAQRINKYKVDREKLILLKSGKLFINNQQITTENSEEYLGLGYLNDNFQLASRDYKVGKNLLISGGVLSGVGFAVCLGGLFAQEEPMFDYFSRDFDMGSFENRFHQVSRGTSTMLICELVGGTLATIGGTLFSVGWYKFVVGKRELRYIRDVYNRDVVESSYITLDTKGAGIGLTWHF